MSQNSLFAKLQKLSRSRTSAPVSHFACPRGVQAYIYSHDVAPRPRGDLDAGFAIMFARHYVAHVCISLDVDLAASGVRSPEGRYVLSAVLHASEENSQGFSTLVPSVIY